jgi:hypothetical protein
VVWIVVGVIALVVALVLLGRSADSAADLLRVLRMPNPAGDAVYPSIADAGPLDQVTSPHDAWLDVALTAQPDDVGTLAAATRSASNGARFSRAIFDDADLSDVIADGDDAALISVPAAPATTTMDASARAGEQDAPAALAAAAPTPQAAPPVRCGWRMCAEGEQCCNWNCSTCVRPGETCPLFCGAPTLPVSAPCGPNTCNVSEVCCNPSCGICVPSGGSCSKEPCAGMYYPVSPTCGMNTCNAGQVCCNPSCGICTNPGEACSLDPCG